MIAPGWALVVATACIALGDTVNRRLRGWLPDDPPGLGRKRHGRPIPLAGVLLLPAIAPWAIAAGRYLELAAFVVVAAVGFEDDRRKEHSGPLDDHGLGWRTKALALLVASALVAATAHDPIGEPGWFALALGLTFVLTNAVNFLDNTDGVTSGIAAASLLVLGLAPGSPAGAATTVAAGCAALAFAPWNWPRPRLFLGDSGAYLLGVALSIAVVPHVRERPLVLLAAALPLVDFAQVVTARIALGIAPWIGDRRHLTHVAQNAGLPRVLVAPLFAGAAAAGAWFAVRGA